MAQKKKWKVIAQLEGTYTHKEIQKIFSDLNDPKITDPARKTVKSEGPCYFEPIEEQPFRHWSRVGMSSMVIGAWFIYFSGRLFSAQSAIGGGLIMVGEQLAIIGLCMWLICD
jgi:hypothetical protein